MKRITMGLMAVFAITVSCQKKESFPLEADTTLYATMEDVTSTRTMLDDDNNVLWSEGDQIVAFTKTSLGVKYQVATESVGKATARFTKISSGNSDDLYAGSELSHNVAYYPYINTADCMKSSDNYELSVNLPTEQIYVPNSFANGSLPMVAVSKDNNITFKNVCGGMKLQFKGTQKVRSVKLQGNNNEKLSGVAVVTAYTDDTKPAITMDSSASTDVTLNCGSGIQLNEDTATEFIIALPPVLFSKGFTATVTDADGKNYTLETDKANAVLRSSLLAMPSITLGDDSGEDEEGLIIPVSNVELNSSALKLYEGYVAQLTATIRPNDATDKTVIWSSDNPAIASVDENGLVTALLSGKTKIKATANNKIALCTITVVASTEYVDEYGVNHGKGKVIGRAIWAPVNCGYHKDDFKYGKLYQWGRKYGQGYDGGFYINGNNADTYYDAIIPVIEDGGVSATTGQHKSKSNVFFKTTSDYSDDWLYPMDNQLWNSGTELNPIKTDYDPCPDGWRIPTFAELNELRMNHSSWTTDEMGLSGYWFSGPESYSSEVSHIFLPAAGYRDGYDAKANYRGNFGGYWSSRPYVNNVICADILWFNNINIGTNNYSKGFRSMGYSVRCVLE